jgi:hypothetical protein
MNEPPEQRWGLLQWGMVLGVVLLLGLWAVPTYVRISKIGNETWGVSYCKQIILALRQFSKDNASAYPDVHFPELNSSNQVFRKLYQEGGGADERIFGCPKSIFVPDGKIGTEPKYEKALVPGECHWMLLKHQTDASRGDVPLIIENSLNADWPPKWDVSDPDSIKRGRAWNGRSIIVGHNDGSVALEKLQKDGTTRWHSQSNQSGKSWMDSLTPEEIAKLSYWDIEEK